MSSTPSKSRKVTEHMKYTRITIFGYIINTIYEVPTKQVGETAHQKC